MVHTVFLKYFEAKQQEDQDNITVKKLGNLLSNIGEHKKWSEKEVKALFKLSDLDGSKTISFREFLIAIAVGYFLKVDSKNAEFKQIQEGFRVVEQAFKEMDSDGSGTVDASELKEALFDLAGGGTGDKNNEVLEARFKELDFNSDGSVSFPEFLYGITKWVGFMDDEEAEEEDSGPKQPPSDDDDDEWKELSCYDCAARA